MGWMRGRSDSEFSIIMAVKATKKALTVVSTFISLIFIFFRRIAGGNQHSADLTAILLQIFILLFGDIIGFEKQFKPVFGFIAFFKSNLQLRDEIILALCVICLVNIRTDWCAAAEELIGDNTFFSFGLYFSFWQIKIICFANSLDFSLKMLSAKFITRFIYITS